MDRVKAVQERVSHWQESEDVQQAMKIVECLLKRNGEKERLAKKLLTCDKMTRFYIFAGTFPHVKQVEGIRSYIIPEGLIPILKFTEFFIDEIGQGVPGLGYIKADTTHGFAPCHPDEKHSMPYFHRDHQRLQETLHDAKVLTFSLAMQAIDFHEEQQKRHDEHLLKYCGKQKEVDATQAILRELVDERHS